MKGKFIIKTVFVALSIFAPLQFAFAELFTEPWPALILPSFSEIGREVPSSSDFSFI